ncbi:MAG TPA: sugar phosphate nucleotidyltransferase [Kofleriaceae bacterium]|nr:sugar phosphate nucleotidyltransferase [Kofleriaceae bacterium]
MSGTNSWFIVLAGGEGKRLAGLTRALYGADVPKQFAVLTGTRSLLQDTLERAAALGDLTRTVVVVTRHHEQLAREQLAPYPGVHLLVQPAGLDTGPGMLLPLAYVRAREPSARVVVLPADHHLPNVEPLRRALRDAASHRASRGRVTLIGVHADRAETEYGWIVPGVRLAGRDRDTVWSVRRFVEKPAEPIAERLRARGAVWNTFMATGPVAAFWGLARPRVPEQVRAFEQWAARLDEPGADDRLRAVYAELRPSNWSVDVLSDVPPGRLALVSMSGSGWSDWGCPRRVFASMHGTPALESLLARVTGPVPVIAAA